MQVDVFNEGRLEGAHLGVETNEVDESDGEGRHTDDVEEDPVQLHVPRQAVTDGVGRVEGGRQQAGREETWDNNKL